MKVKCLHWVLIRWRHRVDIFTAGTGVGCGVPMASNYTPAAETQTPTSWCSWYAGPRQPRLSTVYWVMTTFWQLNATSSYPSTATIISINIHNWRMETAYFCFNLQVWSRKVEGGKIHNNHIFVQSLWTVLLMCNYNYHVMTNSEK